MLPALPMKSAYMRHCLGSSSKRLPNRPPMNKRPTEPMPLFATHLQKTHTKMASITAADKKLHALCIPYPIQGHINPMLKLAKLLHHRGFHITFVLTEYNTKRLLKSRGPNSLDGLPDFRFETIPDGLPPSDADSTQILTLLCESTKRTCLAPLCNILEKFNNNPGLDGNIPPVTCIVADACMTFAIDAAEKFGLPSVIFWSASACSLLPFANYRKLVERGYLPLKDETYLTNGYLETTMDCIPGMSDVIRLRDLPSLLITTDPNDFMVNFLIGETDNLPRCSALVLNTFDEFEHDVLNALSAMYPKVYSIGPLPLLVNQIQDEKLQSIGSNLWKEDSGCIEWLNTKEPNSVVFVNFGSVTVMNDDQLTEFAWGLANSKKTFLWIIRPDIVSGDSAMLAPEFVTETKERSMLAMWCPQEEVLKHSSIGGFLTHCGWNSTIESVCEGVPLICWPFFADQQTNCRYSCTTWGIGMEIDNDVKRDEVEILVRELMEGEKGVEMKMKAMEWKKKAEEAISPMGSSYLNLEKLIKEVLLVD